MPRKDIYHDCVKIALEKEGWLITHDPLNLTVDDTPLFADLGAEAMFVAERQGEKIAVEIKTFGGQSLVQNLHEALGKYNVYKTALSILYPDWNIYLAVPTNIYDNFFQRIFIQKVLKDYNVKLIVYNHESEIIESWINP